MDNTSKFIFDIYKDQKNNLYMPESLAYVHKISNKGQVVIINNERYIEVNKEDIEQVTKESNNFKVPQYKECNLVDKQLDNPLIKSTYQTSFIVYTDQNDKKYVLETLTKIYKITNKGKTILINNERYIEVNDNDIKDIMEKSKYERIPNHKRCKLKEKEEKQISTPKYFTYYEIVDSKKLYINDEILKLCKNNNISIDATNIISINKAPHYEISKENLDKLMKITEYTGQKQSAVISPVKTKEEEIKKVDKEEALKKINELKEMLNKEDLIIFPIYDDILTLPESIKK